MRGQLIPQVYSSNFIFPCFVMELVKTDEIIKISRSRAYLSELNNWIYQGIICAVSYHLYALTVILLKHNFYRVNRLPSNWVKSNQANNTCSHAAM